MYIKAGDTISGQEGTVYATINGVLTELAEVKNIKLHVQKNKAEFKALGHRGKQWKATGWSGTGSMTVHYVTSRWSELMIKYANEGIDTYFTLKITNSDPSSVDKLGSQTVIATDCNMDEADVASIDIDSEFLEQTANFTFSGISIPGMFNELSGDPPTPTPENKNKKK